MNMCVCLSVCWHTSQEPLVHIFCACFLWPWLSSVGIAICYAIPVLRMIKVMLAHDNHQEQVTQETLPLPGGR